MGAFGRYLIAHLGGDIDAYNRNTKPSPKYIPTKEDIQEQDDETLENICGSCENMIERCEEMIKQIQSEDILKYFKTETNKKKFINWRKSFIKKLNK